ncbi:kelch-like protein 24a [Saccoglossus kowalevskii]|uniref:Kelch-like protein 29-like n=1 Tax=Saccoglossus kowalevskii TaxID=10224 RepID=A0ABM0GXJ6_SACKO|nr:PREDICTED: kelch-like protein 29-like [Saccoglossus kowalevskii]
MGCCQSGSKKKVVDPEPGNYIYPSITPSSEDGGHADIPMSNITSNGKVKDKDNCVKRPLNINLSNNALGSKTSLVSTERSQSILALSDSPCSISQVKASCYSLRSISSYATLRSSFLSVYSAISLRSLTETEEEHRIDPSYAVKLLSDLNNFRKENRFTDVLLCAGDVEIPGHRVVLAASSPYILSIFAIEALEDGRLYLDYIEPDILHLLVEYIYTSKLSVTKENVGALIKGTQTLQLNSAEQACQEFVLNLENQDENGNGETASTKSVLYQPYHAIETLLGLNDMRREEIFTDVTFKAEDEEFVCHCVVMATTGDYFEKLLEGSDDEHVKISIKNASASVMKRLVEYTYTSNLDIHHENAKDILALASILRHDAVLEKCTEFLKRRITPANCLGVQSLARKHGVEQLEKAATKVAVMNFKEVRLHPEFFEMCLNQIERLISEDTLDVKTESEVYSAVMQWVKHDVEKRKVYLPELMQSVRLSYLSPKFLEEIPAAEPLIQESEACKKLIRDATIVHLVIRKGKFHRDPRPKARYSFGEVMVIVGGKNKNEQWIKDVQYYHPNERHWYSLASMENDSVEYKVTTLNNDIYVVGGLNCNRVSGETWRYDSLYNDWSRASDLRVGRYLHSLGVANNRIYAIGGQSSLDDNSQSLKSVEKFDRKLNTWQQVQEMYHGVLEPAVTSCGWKLYVISRKDDGDDCVVQYFDISNKTWSVVDSVNITGPVQIAGTIRGQVYIVGGKSKFAVQVYKPDTNELSSGTCEEHAEEHSRDLYSGTILNRRVYVTGGRWVIGKEDDDALTMVTNNMESYDPVQDEWTTMKTVPKALTKHGCVTIRQYIGLPKSK